jgi:hypothetical protein
MKLLAMVLSVLFGSHSFALAQSGAASGSSPATSAGASNGSTGANSREGSTTQGTAGAGPQGNPTNSIHDNSVKKQTGNPGLQSGPVK